MQRLLFFFSLYKRTEKSYHKNENMVTFTLYNFIIRQKRPGKGGAQGPGRASSTRSCSPSGS